MNDTANATQVAGRHYKDKPIQPWDYIAANGLGYFEGNVVKYVSRWRDKGGLDDLRKARHYLDKLIELESSVPAEPAPGADLVIPSAIAPALRGWFNRLRSA